MFSSIRNGTCRSRLELLIGVASLPLLAWSGVVEAHHSAAMYDASKTLQVVGTLKTTQIGNPHSWFWIEVPNAQSGVDLWGFEAGSVAQLEGGQGDIKQDLALGQKVTISYHPLRDGRPSGEMISIQLADGSTLPRPAAGSPPPN